MSDYKPSQDIPLPEGMEELRQFARNWIDTAALHLSNDNYWHERTLAAHKLLVQLRTDIIEEQKLRGLYAVWISKWTDHCPMCDASGVINWTENGAPHGEGYWAMPMQEYCENCIEMDVCPRCGQTVGEGYFQEDSPACPHCGWCWGKNPDDFKPNSSFEADYWDYLFDKIAQVIRGES